MKTRFKLFVLNLLRFFSGKKIIVSLTSYPARYEGLHMIIESILNQKMKADRIILYLYEGEAKRLPESLMKLQSRRFKIKNVNENIRPHKKYYYAFMEFPNDLIITIDDDFIYPDDLVMNLYRKHLQFRNAIICGRCRKVSFSEDGNMLPYNAWPLCYDESAPEMSSVATGVGGVLYSPKLLDKRVFDMDTLKKYALNQDDLWLKIMEVLKGTKTVPVTVNWKNARSLSYESTLFSTNEYGANDNCLRKLMHCYEIAEQDLKD